MLQTSMRQAPQTAAGPRWGTAEGTATAAAGLTEQSQPTPSLSCWLLGELRPVLHAQGIAALGWVNTGIWRVKATDSVSQAPSIRDPTASLLTRVKMSLHVSISSCHQEQQQ